MYLAVGIEFYIEKMFRKLPSLLLLEYGAAYYSLLKGFSSHICMSHIMHSPNTRAEYSPAFQSNSRLLPIQALPIQGI